MPFTDVKGSAPRKVLQGWGLGHVLLAATVAVGDPIGVNNTNQYVLATATNTPDDSLARYVAAEDGVSGDTIAVFRMAILEAAFGATLADFGDPLYLADTAGFYTAAAGSVSQNVGWINDATHILINPRMPVVLDASDIPNDAIDTQHYVAGSVDSSAIGDNEVDSQHYIAGSVDASAIGDDEVDSQHYAADSIDTEHYAAGSVDSTSFRAGAVDTTALADSGVTPTKLHARVLGRVVVPIMTGISYFTADEEVGAYSPVAGEVVAVQFLNESDGTFTAAAHLMVGTYQTACAASGATLIDGAIYRDITINTTFDDVGVGGTLAFTAGRTMGDQPQSCLVEIEYQIKLVV